MVEIDGVERALVKSVPTHGPSRFRSLCSKALNHPEVIAGNYVAGSTKVSVSGIATAGSWLRSSPYKCLHDIHGASSRCDRRPAVKFVAEVEGFTDADAECVIIGTGQDSVARVVTRGHRWTVQARPWGTDGEPRTWPETRAPLQTSTPSPAPQTPPRSERSMRPE